MDSVLMLTIMPTEGCNFRCVYCYECHAPVSMMSRRTLDHIQAYISDQASRFQTVQIAWFGGEPLLCKDSVLETAELVQRLQANHAFRYQSSMTTNGYLLTADVLRELFEAGVTDYQITLDGWNHDETRPHVDGHGTLRTILDNLTAISALPEEEYPFRIALRRNVLAGDHDLSWYDCLHERFGGDRRFSVLVYPVQNWGGASVEKLELLREASWEALQAEHIAYLDQIGLAHTNGQEGLFSQICYARYPHGMVFRANGDIVKCTVCLDEPGNLIGRVDYDKGVILEEDARREWSASRMEPECLSCPEVLSCLNLRCDVSALLHGRPERPCSRRVRSGL